MSIGVYASTNVAHTQECPTFLTNVELRNKRLLERDGWIFIEDHTHDAILNAKAQLVFQVWPLDEDGGHRRTTDDVHLHLHLVLQALLRHTQNLGLSLHAKAGMASSLRFPSHRPSGKWTQSHGLSSHHSRRTLMIP